MIKRLDVSILQTIFPYPDIDDPKTTDRIDFIGGIRGLSELENKMQRRYEVCICNVSRPDRRPYVNRDANLIMPPNNLFGTIFLSGIFIHHLS